MRYKEVTIIIPAKDEENTIAEVIGKCKAYSDDIIVIDGHSTDKTKEIAEGSGVKVCLDGRRGKGDAVRVGIERASREMLVFMDADGSHDPHDIPKLVEPILRNEADHVIGSRIKGGSDELHGDMGEFIRMVGAGVLTLGINCRFRTRLTDTQNGLRAIRKDVALKLGLKECLASIEQEMVIKTLKKGYRIMEVASHEYARRYGCSKIRIKKIWWRFLYTWIKFLLF